ncbi:hypothetical protein PbB2_00843 [Candidatus Phycosocius bacilliformis]|uniref:HTH tetR-type domain-containing protein n=1 Tax=Candidatus Phycosocius bacilliformis TaxID=1445552 RepID=A0A2P2E7Z0_9PROT|nr:TetR/AcrR family transcriptional regulator [Candidatus Phycosocius bacilliformis]GBF57182.1 hypothetical protein PbB2_00843 [Candidatus Phycosocius bacilliformis]
MSRPKGSRGKDYAAKRQELVRLIQAHVLAHPTERSSLRQFAEVCGVSLPTILHYFDNRQGVAEAVLQLSFQDAEPMLVASAQPIGDLATCVRTKLNYIQIAFRRFGLSQLNMWGLSEGLGDQMSGPAYLTYFLEPSLQSCEACLKHYQEVGEVAAHIDIRFAALNMLSPLILLLMHQDGLGGCQVREADVDVFIDHHTRSFCRAVGVCKVDACPLP